jgi:hypothetical protein
MGPFQVICVVAAAELAAGFSTTATGFAQQAPQGCGGHVPMSGNASLGNIGEPIVGNAIVSGRAPGGRT